ncbi:MAG TPA: CHASE4 domain-containing protein, partial [Roseiflexaceae bacterium]|nr:CHASE4 domain-containing protein [Roseiflexaceae bacterium]
MNSQATPPNRVVPETLAGASLMSALRWRHFAKLRVKTLLIVAITLASLFLILYIPLRIFLFSRFIALEEQMLRTDLRRAQSALSGAIGDLEVYNASYAIWDETYVFVGDHDPSYIERNYYNEFFSDNRLNLLLVVDNNGQVVLGKQFDLNTQAQTPLSRRFQQLSKEDPLIVKQMESGGKTGVVLLDEGPMLIVAHEILTSEGHGPSRGTIMMGRFLDASEIQRLAQSTQLSFAFYQLDDPQIPDDLRSVRASSVDRMQPIINALSEQEIAAYAQVDDIDQSSKLVLRLTSPRSVYLQGQAGITYFIASLMIIGFVFGAIILVVLDRMILSRLSRLSASVRQIGASGDLAARVNALGHDELSDLAGEVNSMLAALQRADVERRQAEELREHARVQAEALQAKREVLATVSHELRTPLTPIMGLVDLLMLGEGGDPTEEQQVLLQSIHLNTLRLKALVDDLLEHGQLEANRVGLHFAPTDLKLVLSEAARMFQPECQRKEMRLTYAIAEALPLIEADGKRLGQVIINLLSNALKYTYPRGEITISAFQQSDDEIEVQITDTGVGISPEQQRRLFVPFFRADNPLSNQAGGTGLGLSIAKSFIELHGGRIWIRSTVGIGSTFA